MLQQQLEFNWSKSVSKVELKEPVLLLPSLAVTDTSTLLALTNADFPSLACRTTLFHHIRLSLKFLKLSCELLLYYDYSHFKYYVFLEKYLNDSIFLCPVKLRNRVELKTFIRQSGIMKFFITTFHF